MARTQQSAGLQQPFADVFPKPVISTRAPGSSDTNYPLGMSWINKSSGTAYVLVTVASGSATWAVASPGSSEVDSLTPDTGTTPVEPSSGTITLTGGTNITTTGGTGEMTFDLDDAITVATSITCPLYTVAAGADLAITGVSGQDVIVNLGDSAGSTNFLVQAADGTDLWNVASDGTITFTSLTVTGAFAQTGGTFDVGQDNATNAIQIGGGSSIRAISIGNGTAAHTINIGQSSAGAIAIDTAAGVSIDAATACNFTVTGAADLTLASSAGSVNLTAGEDDAGAILIEADGGTSEKITIHADQGTGVDSIGLSSDDGGITLSAGLASADAINLSASAGGVDIDGALQVNIASSQNAGDAVRINASAGGIDIDAAGAAGEDITLDNAAGSITLTAGEAAADAISLQSTGGLDVDTALQLNLTSSQNAGDAIRLNASAGGIDIAAAGAAGEDISIVNAAGSVIISAGEDDAGAILIEADGGTSEIITIHADQGTDPGSIALTSDDGGITLTAGLASDDAINLVSSSGGVDIDGAMQVNIASSENTADSIVINSSAGGIDITAAGAAGEDIDIVNSAGSVNIEGAESDSAAVVINASGAAGAVQILSGTGGVVMDSGLTMNVTDVDHDPDPYVIVGSDYVLACNSSSAAFGITLPAAPATGRVLVFIDVGGSAGANNITVNGNGNNITAGGTSAASKAIDSNYGTLTLIYTGSVWSGMDVA